MNPAYRIFPSRSDFIYNRSGGSVRRLLIQLYINLIEQREVVQPTSADEGVAFQDLTSKWLAMKNRKGTRAIRTVAPATRQTERSF